MRLGTHNTYLRLPAEVQRMVKEIEGKLNRREKVKVFAPFPCTAWCAWQRPVAKDPVYAKKLEARREDDRTICQAHGTAYQQARESAFLGF